MAGDNPHLNWAEENGSATKRRHLVDTSVHFLGMIASHLSVGEAAKAERDGSLTRNKHLPVLVENQKTGMLLILIFCT